MKMKRDHDYMCDCVKQGLGHSSQCKHHQPRASVLLVYQSVYIPTIRGCILVVVQPTQLKEVMVLLASRAQRSGMLLQYTGHPLQHSIIQPKHQQRQGEESCIRLIPLGYGLLSSYGDLIIHFRLYISLWFHRMSALKETFDPKSHHCVVQIPDLLKVNLRGAGLPFSLSHVVMEMICLFLLSVLPPENTLPQIDQRNPRSKSAGYQLRELKLYPMFPDPVAEKLKQGRCQCIPGHLQLRDQASVSLDPSHPQSPAQRRNVCGKQGGSKKQ